jgi:two-component system cell cycle response regulator
MTRPLVLIADDSAVIRALLRGQLEKQGNEVVDAADGAQALQACRERKPDVILLDVDMPVLDGHDALAALKADANLADIPVVFLTARTETSDVVEGLRLGAHDYLRKPFESAELLARVRAALRVKTLQDDLRARNAELDRMSRTDALTGLSNRRHMEERLREIHSGVRRHGGLLGVLMIDIDRFKSVNDVHGHVAGDSVLRAVALRLQATVRLEDVLGRWGGDEFLVLVDRADEPGVVALAERIRTAIAEGNIASLSGEPIRVTASVGCCIADAHAEAILDGADSALYAAKDAGRDRFAFAPPRT